MSKVRKTAANRVESAKKKREADFPASVILALRKGAGETCSKPGCNKGTVSKSAESSTATSSTGMAAHISAASPGKGARRYDSKMSLAQRKSYENGIWCCYLHGKLIDTDETKYSVSLLQKWKVIAERKADLRQEGILITARHPEVVELGLAEDSTSVSTLAECNLKIGDLVTNACVSEIWGRDVANSTRDFLIEYAKNAFTHGSTKASYVHVKFGIRGVTVECDQPRFDVHSLSTHPKGRGGMKSYTRLLAALHLNLVSCEQRDQTSRLHIPFDSKTRDVLKANPCAILAKLGDEGESTRLLSHMQRCSVTYYFVENYLSFSDAAWLTDSLRPTFNQATGRVAVVAWELSDGVMQDFEEVFPGVEFISVPRDTSV